MAETLKYAILLGTVFLLAGCCIGEENSPLPPNLEEDDELGLLEVLRSPEVDRRNDFFFAKSPHKSVPRIGRRNDFFHKAAKSVPRIGRSSSFHEENRIEKSIWPWSRDMGLYPRIVKKQMGIGDGDYSGLGRHLDLTKEQEEVRLQPIVHSY